MPILPRLRCDLDFLPSPIQESPGLLLRDSMRYSDSVIVIPPPLVPALACFDGEQTEHDLRTLLTQITGRPDVGAVMQNLRDVLHRSGFLRDELYQELRAAREREFAESPVRRAAFAGSAYPEDAVELRSLMARYLGQNESTAAPIAIAAPHVSPEGGWESYRAAYSRLGPSWKDRTFVVLGTSHYGEPERFGLTQKPFETPWGNTRTAPDLLRQLQGQPAAKWEDYCHAVEHSIEFQVVFLQSLFGPDIQVLPILAGSFAEPEKNDDLLRFFDKLGELNAREGDRLAWVLGVDMAHMGTRYGDPAAHAEEDHLLAVRERDLDRIARLNAGDASGFWERIGGRKDDLKWCGSAPLYTFLRAVPHARGTLRRYEQWNIDDASVVSFAGITFE